MHWSPPIALRTHWRTTVPALTIARRLVTADPNDAQAERSLSVILDKLGSVQFMLGNTDEAAQSFTEATVWLSAVPSRTL